MSIFQTLVSAIFDIALLTLLIVGFAKWLKYNNDHISDMDKNSLSWVHRTGADCIPTESIHDLRDQQNKHMINHALKTEYNKCLGIKK